MNRWWKHFLFVLLLVVFGGCAGSCSGCEGCGITPLPGGFPANERIENAIGVRVTQGGLEFVGDNLAAVAPSLLGDSTSGSAGVITFEVPTSSQSVGGILNLTICPNGPNAGASPPECLVEADLGQANITLTTQAPSNLTASGTLAIRLAKLPLDAGFLGSSSVVLTNGGSCSNLAFANVRFDADVSIETDVDPAHGSRKGMSRLRVNAVNINQDDIKNAIGGCGGFVGTILNLLKDLLAPMLIDPLIGELTGTIEQQLCVAQDPAAGVSCPAGTFPDAGGTCRFCTPDGQGQCPDTAECVTMALGVDGKLDLSSALAGISPGAKGGFDFVAAVGGEGARPETAACNGRPCAYGDLDPVGGGITLSLVGGVIPSPTSSCVPLAVVEKPTGIPVPDEIRANTVSGWTGDGPHVGISVNERYLNYLMAGLYNSGALCLGLGGDALGSASSLLNSKTVGALFGSFNDLGRQKTAQPLAVVLRPQKPPVVTIGGGTDPDTDPLLKVELPQLEIDFYVFASDRFLRAMTAVFDITAPVNLDVTASGELAPVVGTLGIANPSVKNNQLIREDPATVATGLADLLASQLGSAIGGAIPPINLNDLTASVGLSLVIPPSQPGTGSPGLRKLEKDSDRFLGIFAALGTAAGTPRAIGVETQTTAEVFGKQVDPAGLLLTTATRENRPRVTLRATSSLASGAEPVEYQLRLDGGLWRAWTTSSDLTVSDASLMLQAVHTVEIRSRVVGRPWTADPTPARVAVRIDATPPRITLDRRAQGGLLPLSVDDVVSAPEAIQVRWRHDSGAWTEWVSAASAPGVPTADAEIVSVEARDEEGNVATTRQALVRGRGDKSLAGESSCSCSVPGATSSTAGGSWLAALLVGAIGLLSRGRRRRGMRAPAVYGAMAAMAAGSTFVGCSCSDDSETGKTAATGGASGASGAGGAGGEGAHVGCPDDTGNCETLTPGLVGSYTSAAVAPDGTVWVAGYNDIGFGDFQGFLTPYLWGDLVVGTVQGGKVAWKHVDGVPTEPEPDPYAVDVRGWRGGFVDPGDDVGLWTSLAVDATAVHVSYFDVTHKALKYARSTDAGATWSIHTVQGKAQAELGRYSKLLLVDGKPVIAYQFLEGPSAAGSAQSGVRVARAANASPGAESDWAFSDAYTDTATPCRASLCATGTSCDSEAGACVASATGCDPGCESGSKCLDVGGAPTCRVVAAKDPVEAYVDAAGLYIAAAPTAGGLGLVFYDRIHGNLYAVREEGGAWQPPLLVDGQDDSTNPAVDTGDVGIGASLFIDGTGAWHIAYADGFDEVLMYARLGGGTTLEGRQEVDLGAAGGVQSVVGDDTAIRVAASGEVQIAYQDATLGALKWATGTPNAWSARALTVDGVAGHFNTILDVGGAPQIVTWWRKAQPSTLGDVTLVTP
ncbi:MAG: hypothetical protein IT376_01040 [Polyangiaceae bacterium]|nr:hypothetical protein [Polyangiaceae bacterium]